MTDIFISYSRKDLAIASTLAKTLGECGYTVWWDMSGLHGGQTFAREIQQQLSKAKCAIVIWSEHSVLSNWVHSEASFADSRGILLTAMCQGVYAPMPFNNRHNENLRGWNGNVFDEDFQKLLKAIGNYCPVPSGQPRQSEESTPSTFNKPQSPSVESSNAQKTSSSEKPTINTAFTQSEKESTGLNKKLVTVAVAVVVAGMAYTFLPDKKVTDTESAVAVKASEETTEQFSRVTKTILENAKLALADDRLTTPENHSVLFYAGSVLKSAPNNTEAKQLLSDATERYHSWAKLSIDNKSFDKAQGYLDTSQALITEFALSSLNEKQSQLTSILKSSQEEAAQVAAENKVYKLANNLTLLPIPTGSFMMGSNNGSDSEKPVHKVTFTKPFWMSKTEVTFDQYDAYATSKGKPKPDDKSWGRGTRPVINVSWNDAQGYVNWLTKNNTQGLQCRLPSESEWEYAARAGSTTKYSWGDTASHEQANYYGKEGRDQWVDTAPVGSFPANKWGLQDMHGNVWEWVQDRWHDNYNGAPNNGEVWEADGDDSRRVLRGGSWFVTPDGLRSSDRLFITPVLRNFLIGFRIVCSSH